MVSGESGNVKVGEVKVKKEKESPSKVMEEPVVPVKE